MQTGDRGQTAARAHVKSENEELSAKIDQLIKAQAAATASQPQFIRKLMGHACFWCGKVGPFAHECQTLSSHKWVTSAPDVTDPATLYSLALHQPQNNLVFVVEIIACMIVQPRDNLLVHHQKTSMPPGHWLMGKRLMSWGTFHIKYWAARRLNPCQIQLR